MCERELVTYSKDVVKEFAIQRLRLTPEAMGKTRNDVPSVVRSIGGLQYGGHRIELLNRFEDFQPEWFDYWYENHTLIDGHVLRGALRIVNVDDYPYYFMATRSVARRRTTYQICPSNLTAAHHDAFEMIAKYGPFTPSEFASFFDTRKLLPKGKAKKLLYDLYNYGKIARIGRKANKPLYHMIEKLPYTLHFNVDEEEAKRWLFLKCLSIYGPFRLTDIAHWVGWTLTETQEIGQTLVQDKATVEVRVEGQREPYFARTDDLPALDALVDNLPAHSFIRLLFNDDALLLGYYKRLASDFGYPWTYPQFREGAVWRAAILYRRQIIGEADIDMYADSPDFKVRNLILLKKFAIPEILTRIEGELRKHATFHNKTLITTAPRLPDNNVRSAQRNRP